MHKWRNWKTRQAKDLVPEQGMWVRSPPCVPKMLRVAQLVRAPGCGPGGLRFESAHAPHGILAQLVER